MPTGTRQGHGGQAGLAADWWLTKRMYDGAITRKGNFCLASQSPAMSGPNRHPAPRGFWKAQQHTVRRAEGCRYGSEMRTQLGLDMVSVKVMVGKFLR